MKITYGILEVETQEGGCSEEIIVDGIKTIKELMEIYYNVSTGKQSWDSPPRHNCSYYMIVEEPERKM